MSEILDRAQTFEALRAEVEAPWLGQMFLPPREFDLMTASQSVLVMGGEGSGKTALEIQLKAYADQKKTERLLIASWRPQLSANPDSSGGVVEIFMSQAMDVLSFAFLQTLARTPAVYFSAPSWARDFMAWFIHQYLQGDHEFYLSQLADQSNPEGLEIISQVLSSAPRPLFPHLVSASVLPHLTGAVKAFGFQSIWIFIDGLDTLYHIARDNLEQFLGNFLSTLELFEDPAFMFKIIVSNELGQRLQTARGVVTRRFKTYHLKWQEEELMRIVEKRLALVLQRDWVSLGELCRDRAWIRWLKRYAGDSPRTWLSLTQPILAVYLNKGNSLNKTEWLTVYRQSPPLLHIDLETGHVFIGAAEVTVSAIGYKLLAHLYENRSRSCTKSELFYCAYKGLSKEPRNKEDVGWEDTSSWEGMIDTALWRLRQSVEWDSGDNATPLYIVSEKGRGQIRLRNAV